jgi:fructose-1,6-bisphosphatase/sedoheptulose 1,7-bisphosphatase-like protein
VILCVRFSQSSPSYLTVILTCDPHAGTPEGVIAAAALKCMGGSLQGRLYPRNAEEKNKAIEQGYNVEQVCSLSLIVFTH